MAQMKIETSLQNVVQMTIERVPIAIYSSAQNSTKTGRIFVQNVHFLIELASYIMAESQKSTKKVT